MNRKKYIFYFLKQIYQKTYLLTFYLDFIRSINTKKTAYGV